MKDYTFKKIISLIETGNLNNITLAFQLAKSQNISEERIMNNWEELISFLENNYLKFINIRKKDPIQLLLKILNTTELNSISQLVDKKITSLPEIFGNMINLVELDLLGNDLTKLPKSIEKLSQLKFLELSGNQIKSLPKNMNYLINLETLLWTSNSIELLPKDTSFPKNIKTLSLQNNFLKEFPPSIEELVHLEFLNLSDNLIEKAPNDFSNLKNLKELHVKRNPLPSSEKRKIKDALKNCKISI